MTTPTPNAADELKSCPFCGGAPELHKDKMLGDAWLGCMNPICTVAPYIEAPDLSSRGGEAYAAEAWNRRAAATQVADEPRSSYAAALLAEQVLHMDMVTEKGQHARALAREVLRGHDEVMRILSLIEHATAPSHDDGAHHEAAWELAREGLATYQAANGRQRTRVAEPVAWQPIATAPRDGTHILVCNAAHPYDDHTTFNQNPPAVVHWWHWPEDKAGFYLSTSLTEQMSPFEYTHWKPLGSEPCDTKRLEAEMARYPKPQPTLICPACGVDRFKAPCATSPCKLVAEAASASQPLAPAQSAGQKPLKDEVIDETYFQSQGQVLRPQDRTRVRTFARAVERAHGIGDSKTYAYKPGEDHAD